MSWRSCSSASVGETFVARVGAAVHLATKFVCCPKIIPRVAKEEVKPPIVVEKCEMPMKPPKPRCDICKTGLMTCEKHMVKCASLPFWRAVSACVLAVKLVTVHESTVVKELRNEWLLSFWKMSDNVR